MGDGPFFDFETEFLLENVSDIKNNIYIMEIYSKYHCAGLSAI